MIQFDLAKLQRELNLGTLEHHQELPSTNDRAIARLKQGSDQAEKTNLPLLVLTDSQTLGRGQFHRRWISNHGSLTLTLGLPSITSGTPCLPLIVGLAVCESIETVIPAVKLQLKWPNDILLEGRKLGGILIEQIQSHERVIATGQFNGVAVSQVWVVGIGVNVNQAIFLENPQAENRPSPADPTAAPISLSQHCGQEANLTELTLAIVHRVIELISQLELEGPELLARCDQRMVFRERKLTLTLNSGEVIVGRYEGLSERGELIVGSGNGLVKIASACEIRW